MKVIEISQATDSLRAHVENMGDQRLVVTREGRPVAVLVPVDPEDDLESIALSTNPRFMAIIEQSRRSAREQGTFTADEVRRHFDQREAQEAK